MNDFIKSLLTFSWRASRKQYILTMILLIPLYLVISLLIELDYKPTLVIFLLFIFLLYLSFANAVKRIHDIWKNGILCLLLLVPLINITFWLYLLFKKWDEWKNKYGEDPLMKNQEELTAI